MKVSKYTIEELKNAAQVIKRTCLTYSADDVKE